MTNVLSIVKRKMEIPWIFRRRPGPPIARRLVPRPIPGVALGRSLAPCDGPHPGLPMDHLVVNRNYHRPVPNLRPVYNHPEQSVPAGCSPGARPPLGVASRPPSEPIQPPKPFG